MSAEGGILVIPDTPKGLEFSIDTMSYTTGDSFRGISVIPEGLHFCYYSTTGSGGARQGFFFWAHKQEILIRSYESKTEEILPRNILSDEQTLHLKQAVIRGDLNRQLGPYPHEQHHRWYGS